MRFASTKRLTVLLVAVLATSSLVSSLSIPQKRDTGVDLLADDALMMAKRGVRGHVVATSSARPDPSSRSTARASTPAAARPSSSSPRPSSASSASESASESSSVPVSSAPNTMASTTMSSNLTANATASMNTSTTAPPTTNQAAVPTGGMSTGAIAGIGVVGGVAVIGAAIFAVMRYKRKSSLTQDLANKSVNQFSTPSSYPAASPFSGGNNTGYERLSDPSLSGASVPSGVPQPGIGTFTVISTYTPTLGDELEIQAGDKVTILVEYDDGWCQGVNESRGKVKGVFPKHCVDYGTQGGVMDDAGRGKRVSSMYGSGGYRM